MDPNQNFFPNGHGLPGSDNWNEFFATFSQFVVRYTEAVRADILRAIDQHGRIDNSTAIMQGSVLQTNSPLHLMAWEGFLELARTVRIEPGLNQRVDTVPETKEDEKEEMQEKEDDEGTEEKQEKEDDEGTEEKQEKEDDEETEEMQEKEDDEETEEMQEKEDDEETEELQDDDTGNENDLCTAESGNVAEEDAPPDPCGDESKTDKTCDPTKTDKTCGDPTKTDDKKDVEGKCSTHCSKTVTKKDSKTEESKSDDKSQTSGDKRKADEDANAPPSKIARTSQGNLRNGSSSNNLLSSANFNGNIISFENNVLWPMIFFGASRVKISPPNRVELQGENRSSGRVEVTRNNDEMRITVLGASIFIQLREGINSDDVAVSLNQNGIIEIVFPINDSI